MKLTILLGAALISASAYAADICAQTQSEQDHTSKEHVPYIQREDNAPIYLRVIYSTPDGKNEKEIYKTVLNLPVGSTGTKPPSHSVCAATLSDGTPVELETSAPVDRAVTEFFPIEYTARGIKSFFRFSYTEGAKSEKALLSEDCVIQYGVNQISTYSDIRELIWDEPLNIVLKDGTSLTITAINKQ
ncbi:hypothetical protein ACI2KR_08195 [Pseudomonas luteola]